VGNGVAAYNCDYSVPIATAHWSWGGCATNTLDSTAGASDWLLFCGANNDINGSSFTPQTSYPTWANYIPEPNPEEPTPPACYAGTAPANSDSDRATREAGNGDLHTRLNSGSAQLLATEKGGSK
jgi:hypothetical protein